VFFCFEPAYAGGDLVDQSCFAKTAAAFNDERSYCISKRMSNPLCLTVGSKRFLKEVGL
jgi:hypothetical protein